VGALDCAAPHWERFCVRQDKLSNDDRVKFVEDNIDQVLPRPPHAFGSGVANEEIRSCTTLIFFMRSKRHPHFILSEDLRNPATRRWAEAPRESATAAVSRVRLQVLAVGANALGPEGRWWTEEDDPFQLLAACQARIFIDTLCP
jgi:hypothetical protein